MFDNLLGEMPDYKQGNDNDLDLSKDSNPFVKSHFIKNMNYHSGSGNINIYGSTMNL